VEVVKFNDDQLPAESAMLVTISVADLRRIIAGEIRTAIQNVPAIERDVLLTPENTAALIGVNRRWLYRHADKLPFARRISRKNLRFSEAGLRRWVAAKKPGSR